MVAEDGEVENNMAYNFLIVDDSAIIRAVVAKTLHMTGFEIGLVLQAANGKEALDMLEKNWVDIVLADINMPIMTGIELVEHMANSALIKSIPVVIISTERSETRISELKSKGVRAYLNKPFTPENIKKVLEEIFNGPKV